MQKKSVFISERAVKWLKCPFEVSIFQNIPCGAKVGVFPPPCSLFCALKAANYGSAYRLLIYISLCRFWVENSWAPTLGVSYAFCGTIPLYAKMFGVLHWLAYALTKHRLIHNTCLSQRYLLRVDLWTTKYTKFAQRVPYYYMLLFVIYRLHSAGVGGWVCFPSFYATKI